MQPIWLSDVDWCPLGRCRVYSQHKPLDCSTAGPNCGLQYTVSGYRSCVRHQASSDTQPSVCFCGYEQAPS